MRAKENIKTVILILLILSSCILALKIWAFDSGMIFSGSYLYKLVEWVNVGVKYGFNSGQYVDVQEEQAFGSIFYPNQIIINKDTKHYFSYFDDKKMERINQDIKDIIRNSIIENQKTWVDTDEKELKNIISKDSIFIKYSAEFSYDIFSEYIGVLPIQFGQEINFDRILINNDVKNNKINLYFKNTNSQIIKKFQTELSQKNLELFERILEQKEQSYLCTFGFENKTSKKVALGDYVILLEGDIITNDIEQVNPITQEKNISGTQRLLDNLLKVFDFNLAFLKPPYDDAQGNKVYVENNSTFVIYKDGFIEYFVSNPQRGLKIDSAGEIRNFSKIKVLNISTNLLLKIRTTINVGGNVATVRYAGMEQNVQDKTIRVYYDYIIDGIPFNCKNGGIKGYPITIDINENGQISYVKFYANTFKYTNNKITNLNYETVFNLLLVNNVSSIASLDLCYEKSPFSDNVATKWNYIS